MKLPANALDPCDFALAAARLGWRVFPLVPNRKTPLVKDWEHVATTDPAQLNLWFSQWPDANYGVACGPSGVIVVDLDVKNDIDGIRNWAELTAGMDLPAALRVDTASGGQHLYWRGSGVRNSAGQVAPGVDVRGEGGFVVGPGSVVDGSRYTVVVAS